MARTIPAVLLSAVLAALAAAGPAAAQQVVPPPPPDTVPPPPPPPPPSGGPPPVAVPAPVPAVTPGWQPAPGMVPPPAPPPPPLGDPTCPPAPAAPLCAPPGWFAALEVGVFAPHFRNGLTLPVTVGGATAPVFVPGVLLDWTGSPRIELGYRLADGAGAFLVSYRSLVTSGGATEANFDPAGAGFVKSLLNLNVVDLLYRSGPCQFVPLWDLTWDLGVRIGTAYYNSRASGGVVEERVSNNFVGAGPVAGVEVARRLEEIPGLAVFSRLQGGGMFGGVTQNAEETIRLADGTLIGGANRQHQGRTVPFVNFQLGLSYMPQVRGRWMRFSTGYEIEKWWDVGDLPRTGSVGDLTFQGIFFRGEFIF